MLPTATNVEDVGALGPSDDLVDSVHAVTAYFLLSEVDVSLRTVTDYYHRVSICMGRRA